MSSRATVDGDWQGVDTVALQVDDRVKKYVVTASGDYKRATLSSDDPFYWINHNDITVSAWWPYDENNFAQMPPVVVEQDQSSLENFQKSDFIATENQTVKFDNPMLTFTHRTARVSVTLKCGTGITNVDGATVSLTSLSTNNDNPGTIKTYNASGETYEALAAPQTIEASNSFIQVVLDNTTFTYRPQDDIVLLAGKRYLYNVNVNATGLTLEGNTISDWTNDGKEIDGIAENRGYAYDEASNTYFVYLAKGLLAWAEAARQDPSTNCTLTDNIAMPTVDDGEENWTPIGNEFEPYTGTFDGGGHSITGLTVYRPNENYVGMFSAINKNGAVQHLILIDVKITGYNYVGGVAGWNYGTMTGCYTMDIPTNNNRYCCYVAGWNSGILTGCYATGDVTENYYLVERNDSTLTACYDTNDDSYDRYGITRVDGTDVTWLDAQSGMNEAIDTWNANNPDKQCNWHYEGATETTPPTLVKNNTTNP